MKQKLRWPFAVSVILITSVLVLKIMEIAIPKPMELRRIQNILRRSVSTLPMIYVITPTYYRAEQKADLTRLSQTLRLVPRLHWIVIEDSEASTDRVKHILTRSQLPYTHLVKKTTDQAIVREKYKLDKKWKMDKGVEQRNEGLNWITNNAEFPSVFYCCDDDNVYDLRLFDEMRYTKKISVFPVGLIAQCTYEGPIVKNGKVVAWSSCWLGNRKYPIDMAGFAVNTEVLKRPEPPRFDITVKLGRLESDFVDQIADGGIDELEPKASNCSEVLVWHTKTKRASFEDNKKLEQLLAKHNASQIKEV